MFVYQPLLSILELTKDKGTDNNIGWKSKGFFKYDKRRSLHSTFSSNIKYFGYQIGKKHLFSCKTTQKGNQNCKCLYGLWFR